MYMCVCMQVCGEASGQHWVSSSIVLHHILERFDSFIHLHNFIPSHPPPSPLPPTIHPFETGSSAELGAQFSQTGRASACSASPVPEYITILSASPMVQLSPLLLLFSSLGSTNQ